MLKLARNVLGDKEIFFTENGKAVSWNYIKELYNVQKTDVSHLDDKLKNKHIKWHTRR